MRENIYYKNVMRTIKGSLGRYLAILLIVALGVGFFAGVKNTRPSMLATCDRYVKNQELYDYRLISTWGFTWDDVHSIAQEEAVAAANGAVTADFFSEDAQGNSVILRAHSITKDVNQLDLVSGRMPQSPRECVVDEHFFKESDIGSTIRITDENDKETKDALKRDSYVISGIVRSPYYLMKTERGVTSLGDGRVDAFIYLMRGTFTSEYFTEILITCKQQGFIYSQEYNDHIKAVESEIKAAAEKRGDIRYDEVVADAQNEIDKGQRQIEDGKTNLKDGKKQLADGKKELASQKADAEKQLNQAKQQLDSSNRQLEAGKRQLQQQKAKLQEQKKAAQSGLTQAEQGLKQLEQIPAENRTPEMDAQINALKKQKNELRSAIGQLDGGLQNIAAQEAKLASSEKQLKAGEKAYQENKKQAKQAINAGEQQLKDSEKALAEGEQTLKESEKDLEKARKDLKKIKRPELYIQTREDNTGYTSFESNSQIVDGIAKVFPLFFFLIAALVCSTTMTRMIEEERTQIGTFRAIGYTNGRIMGKYMIYSGSAAIIGCLAGFFAGSKFLPMAIWVAYGMLFGFAPLDFYFHWPLLLISIAVALLCSAGTTYLACRGQLRCMPAEILRPKAPKAGKRIILERIGFLWSRMKFLHKVSTRNIFRYKKRMLMMLVGIGGCTALVLTGFGILDSIAGVAGHQYSQVETYDMMVVFSEEQSEKDRAEFERVYGNDLENMAMLQQTAVTVAKGGTSKTCDLMITDDHNMKNAVQFHSVQHGSGEGEIVPYPDKGEAVVNHKMAEMLHADVGDTITVTYDDTKEAQLKVSGIYRNYVSNYIYISAETFEQLYDETYKPSSAFVTCRDGVDQHEFAEQLNDFGDVAGISLNQDVQKHVEDMMISLNYIVVLVIGCAGALAFIVLFNLGNINITEREREIATIKVLGFYPRETGSYVFRENFVLVVLGIIVGLPAGAALHRFVMSQIVVDMVTFNQVIELKSYGFSVVIVLLFSCIVDLIMRRKLKRINMAEALKSIE